MTRRRRTPRRRSRSCLCPSCSPHPGSKNKPEIASWLIEEPIAPWLTEKQKRYIHPCGTSDAFLGLLLPAFTLSRSYDNFQQAILPDNFQQVTLRDAELFSGTIAVVLCVSSMFLKFYEFPDLWPVLTLKSWIELPIWPPNIRIYRDTAIVVIISYVLLLDINSSYLWLAIFPVIAIAFISAVYVELCPTKDHGEANSGSSSTGGTESNDEKTTKEPEELEFIVMVPFCALFMMALLDDHDRFAISQFLLFLSSTLGALTRMMMRLPAGAVTPASELLHKTFLLLLLVTAHTVAAELLGEDVVLMCMPEVVPVLLWFSLHLDRDSSIISVDKMKLHRNVLIVLGAVFVALSAYLATSMDESGLSRSRAIFVSCGVSGLLTYYLVFMLHQWPGQQEAGKDDVATDISEAICLKSKKQAGKGKGATASLEEAVQSEEQAVGSLEEAVQLLKFWANALLIAAAAAMFLVLECLVAVRLGLHEPLVDTLPKFSTTM